MAVTIQSCPQGLGRAPYILQSTATIYQVHNIAGTANSMKIDEKFLLCVITRKMINTLWYTYTTFPPYVKTFKAPNFITGNYPYICFCSFFFFQKLGARNFFMVFPLRFINTGLSLMSSHRNRSFFKMGQCFIRISLTKLWLWLCVEMKACLYFFVVWSQSSLVLGLIQESCEKVEAPSMTALGYPFSLNLFFNKILSLKKSFSLVQFLRMRLNSPKGTLVAIC